MELQEETTSIAEDGANLIPSPERSRRGRAVLAGWLCCFAVVSSHRSHDCGIGIAMLSWFRDCDDKKG